MRRLVADLQPALLAAEDAAALWETFNRVERFASAAKTLLAQHATQTEVWKEQGFATPADHLAQQAGITTNRARDELAASRRLTMQPEVEGALRSGEISVCQAGEIAAAVADDPNAAAELLEIAHGQYEGAA